MNWLERLNNIELTIITGDGKEYKPIWKNAIKNITYNTKGFDFIERDGSYVARKRRSGRQFPILLYFQGEDHLKTASDFEKSAADPRPWTINHPYYDVLTVHPVDLKFDNSVHNITKITGAVWETNEERYPQGGAFITSIIRKKKNESDTNVAENITDDMGTPDSTLVSKAVDSVNVINETIKVYISDTKEVEKFRNKINRALADSQNIVSNTFSAIVATREALNAIINNDLIKISDKIDAFETLIKDFDKKLLGDNKTYDSVKLYEAQATETLTAASISAVIADYDNRAEVINTLDRIDALYEYYINSFESISENQNSSVAIELDSIISQTLANLYQVAFNSKQTRRFVTTENTNIVVLAHQFYGQGDENLQEFIKQNDIGLDEHLEIPVNREIVYFV